MTKKIKAPVKRLKKDSPHYVDNKKFYQEIVAYRESVKKAEAEGKEKPRLSNYIGECILRIAERNSVRYQFVNYSFRDEMVFDAIENCIMYFDTFDPERTKNPFAYFTEVCTNAFIRRIEKEEKIRYATYKLFQNTILLTENGDLLDADEDHTTPKQLYDNINDFMGRYEEKQKRKKQKLKEAAAKKAANANNLGKFYSEVKDNEGKEQTDPASTDRILDSADE